MVVGGIFAGIWTLIPTEWLGWGANKECPLGYVAHCSFTPYSTLILFGMAATGLFLLYKSIKLIIRKIKSPKQTSFKSEIVPAFQN